MPVPVEDGCGGRWRPVVVDAVDSLLLGGGYTAWPLTWRGHSRAGSGRTAGGDRVSEAQLLLLMGAGCDPITDDPLGRAFPVQKSQRERIDARIAAVDPALSPGRRARWSTSSWPRRRPRVLAGRWWGSISRSRFRSPDPCCGRSRTPGCRH